MSKKKLDSVPERAVESSKPRPTPKTMKNKPGKMPDVGFRVLKLAESTEIKTDEDMFYDFLITQGRLLSERMWYEMVPNRMGPYSKIPGSEYAKVFYCGEKDDRVVVTFSKILSMSVVSNMLIANPKIVMIHHCALSEEVEGMIRAYQVLPESNFTVSSTHFGTPTPDDTGWRHWIYATKANVLSRAKWSIDATKGRVSWSRRPSTCRSSRSNHRVRSHRRVRSLRLDLMCGLA